jgi:Zn-dependent protease with chaperone function
MRLFFAVMALIGVAACAPVTKPPTIDSGLAAQEAELQRQAAIKEEIRLTQRIFDVGWRLASANAPLCGSDALPMVGVGLITKDVIKAEMRPSWEKVTGVSDAVQIQYVMRGSPADQAGLLAGDKILAVDAIAVEAGKIGLEKLLGRLKDAGDKEQTLQFRRGDEVRQASLKAALSCSYPLALSNNNLVNAYADGKKVVVFAGLTRFAATDDELALVIGHEMAHNTQSHITKSMGNRFAGALLGATLQVLLGMPGATQVGADAGQIAFSQDFEREADYVGVYHAARAGYDVRGAADLWRRMGRGQPPGHRPGRLSDPPIDGDKVSGDRSSG